MEAEGIRIRSGRVTRIQVVLVALAVVAGLSACENGAKPAPTSHSSGGTPSAAPGAVEKGDWGAVINPGGEPVSGGTLRIDQVSAPAGISVLHYLTAPADPEGQVEMQIYDQLVEYLPGSIEPQPGLAESWDVSKDGLTYTFNLRQAKWSDGSPVTSADVKFSLKNAQASAFVPSILSIDSIETPDDSTVILHMKEPRPALIYDLGTVGLSIVPSKIVQAMGVDAYNKHPIGSGPFVVKKWTPDQEIVLVRNKNYWRVGLPHLDEVDFVATPDDNTRVLNLESGTSDVIDFLPFSQIDSVNASGRAHALIGQASDMNLVLANNNHPPFDETAVRRALAFATPVKSINDVVFFGHAEVMNTIVPKLKYWTPDAKAYPYDLGAARAELAKSSVPHGFKAEILIDGSDQASASIAQILQQSWKEIGVDLKISPVDGATQGERWAGGDYELNLFPPGALTSDPPVEDAIALLFFDSPETHNLYSWYHDPKVSNLLAQAVVEPNEATRADLYRQFQVSAMADPLGIPLVYTPDRAGVSDRVHNFAYLLPGAWRLELAWMDQGA